jgi:hypothetical protein
MALGDLVYGSDIIPTNRRNGTSQKLKGRREDPASSLHIFDPKMTGRLAVWSHRRRIEAAFRRAVGLDADAELLADYSKYLCILVAGYIERSLSEIVLEHARRCGAPSLQKFVEHNTKKFTNANTEKLLRLLGSFDSEWRSILKARLTDEQVEAVNSVYAFATTLPMESL